jgi:uncharacterized protein
MLAEVFGLGAEMKGDLETARKTQFDMVPGEVFRKDDAVVHARMRPAKILGGDYYDVLELDERRLAVILGPFALLTPAGRQEIGICGTSRSGWLLWGLLIGALAAGGIIVLGFGLYDFGSDNWVITLRNTYREVALPLGKWPAFALLALPAAIVSPVGEEFFFRGLFRFSLMSVVGNATATLANALAFGSVHLLHHGIWKDAAGLHLRPGSGLMLVLVMMGLSWVFTLCRLRSGSLWPAVLAHSACTLCMNVTIFCMFM